MTTSSSSDLSREVRVFISSTFRDMDSERNYLVKDVFPQMRKRCSLRGIEFTELDLRWGVTEEEAKQGKVIKICLSEIDRCRPSMPFFIGILGERYGWIPDHEDLEKHREILDDFGWVEKDVKDEMSITEMEMQYAVLRNSQMKGKAFFFLRESENIAEEFHEKSGSLSAKKLNKLKILIRKQKDFPVHDFHNNEELGKQVEEELWSVIEQFFPIEFDNDPLTLIRKEHATFARSRTTLYIGGEKYYQKLENHFESDMQPIVITGAGGMGKSALLANWLGHFREQHPDVFILQHYIGGAPDSTDYTQVLRRMIEEMKKEFGLNDEIPSEPEKLKEALPIIFAKTSTKGKWILVLDALNQIEERDNAKLLNWLPDFIPPFVRVYISSTTGSTLELLQKRDWETITIEPLTIDDRKELISRYLMRYSKNLPIETLNRIAEDKESENPLILRTLLDELRLFSKHKELNQRIEYYISTKSPEEFFDRVLERMEMDYEGDHKGMVGKILSLIYCSRKGISEKEILEITNIPPLYWSPLYIALENLLVSHGGLLNISHDFFSKAVGSRFITNEVKGKLIHQKLANYFFQDKYSSRAFDELVYQLTYSEEWDEVIKILTDFNYFMEKCKDNKLEGILDDYQLAFLKAPENNKNKLNLWYSFFKERIHILRRGDKQWPSYKIMFQLAMEHADESPITKQAEEYLSEGKVDWLWLCQELRLKRTNYINPTLVKSDRYIEEFRGSILLIDGGSLLWDWQDSRKKWDTLRIWDQDVIQAKVIKKHIGDIFGTIELSNGKLLSWSWENTLKIWDNEDNSLKVFDGNSMNWHEKGKFIELLFEPLKFKIRDRTNLTDRKKYHTEYTDLALNTIPLNDGNILSWSGDKRLILWNKKGNPVKVLEGHTSSVNGAVQLLNGNLLSWSNDKTLMIWDKEGELLKVLEGHTSSVNGALQQINGNLLSWSADKTLMIWDKEGKSLKVLVGHVERVNGVKELSNENLLSWSADKLLMLWDQNGNPLKVLSGHNNSINGVIELSDNNILSWSFDDFRIWNNAGDLIKDFEDSGVSIRGVIELNNGNLLSWSWGNSLGIDIYREVLYGTILCDTFVKWNGEMKLKTWNIEGNFLEEESTHDYYLKYPEWQLLFAGKQRSYSYLLYTCDFFKSTGILSLNSNRLPLALWFSETCSFTVISRYLFQDGTIVVNTDIGHLFFLKLYDGKKRITLADLEEKIKSTNK